MPLGMMGVSRVFEGELVEHLLTGFCCAEPLCGKVVDDALERLLEPDEVLRECFMWNKMGPAYRTRSGGVRGSHRGPRAGKN